MITDKELNLRVKEEADMLIVCKGYDYKTAMNVAKERVQTSLKKSGK